MMIIVSLDDGIYSTIGKNRDDKCGPRIVYEYTILFIKRGMQKGSFGSLYTVRYTHFIGFNWTPPHIPG